MCGCFLAVLISYENLCFPFWLKLLYCNRNQSWGAEDGAEAEAGAGPSQWVADGLALGSQAWTVSNLKVAQQFHALLNTGAVSIRQAYYANVWTRAVGPTELDHNRIVVQLCHGAVITICKLFTQRII